MKTKPYRSAPGALLVVLVLVLAGCGTNQPAPSQTAISTTQAASTSTTSATSAATSVTSDTSASGGASPTRAGTGDSGAAPNIVSALATATVLAGQADAGPAAQGIDMSKVDACKLLSQAEIEAIMGPVKYDPHNYSSTEGAQKQCIYVATVVEDNAKVEGKFVNLVIWPTSSWEMLKAGRSESVSGIGDEAYTSELGPTGLALWALFRDRAVVNVEVFPKDLESAKKLALKALEHLP